MISNFCPICEHDKIIIEEELVSGAMLECSRCGVIFFSDLESQHSVFPDFSRRGSNFSTLSKNQKLQEFTPTERAAYQWILMNVSQEMPVTDLFCETCRLPHVLSILGYDVRVYDPVRFHVSLATELGLPASILDPGQNGKDIEPSHIFILIESMVRLVNPLGFLRNLRETSPNCTVIASFPCATRSLLVPGFKHRTDYPPDQLYRFDHDSLNALFSRAGFALTIEKVYISDQVFSRQVGVLAPFFRFLYRLMNEADYSWFVVAS